MTDVNVPGIVSNPPETRLKQILPTSTTLSFLIREGNTVIQLVIVPLDNSAGDAGFIGSGFNHPFNLSEEMVEIFISPFS